MKLHDIQSDRLPEIDDSVKECVNLGEWLLFKSEASAGHRAAAFYLKTGTSVFELSDRGKVLHKVEDGADKLEIDELFYFSDIRKPTSLSNTRV
ncbi:hypothetical protein LGM43_05350 [Burkholderia seminalis]|uniref:hypothetical protein n=1 Tax=Burkholderia cepacia complex TaxID=87882 RepID=UPI001592E2B2|nr:MULTISPECIES: hypothetical protein [Burkholderia cepacia complex]MBR8431671.1 hypothetical protein [Burkholderia cenocepacia]MCA7949688.1 hypothetical protein [Burkholderia seminalis]